MSEDCWKKHPAGMKKAVKKDSPEERSLCNCSTESQTEWRFQFRKILKQRTQRDFIKCLQEIHLPEVSIEREQKMNVNATTANVEKNKYITELRDSFPIFHLPAFKRHHGSNETRKESFLPSRSAVNSVKPRTMDLEEALYIMTILQDCSVKGCTKEMLCRRFYPQAWHLSSCKGGGGHRREQVKLLSFPPSVPEVKRKSFTFPTRG
ncbi:uncharacterized protein LOC135298834 isoform X2 [Passer domesticus]|uniref:uncharacterized protein LOC135298834 isoform X2 n=1 Tax=Passer domesticus TaxID=48849 RepID=UPI0030FE02CB